MLPPPVGEALTPGALAAKPIMDLALMPCCELKRAYTCGQSFQNLFSVHPWPVNSAHACGPCQHTTP